MLGGYPKCLLMIAILSGYCKWLHKLVRLVGYKVVIPSKSLYIQGFAL